MSRLFVWLHWEQSVVRSQRMKERTRLFQWNSPAIGRRGHRRRPGLAEAAGSEQARSAPGRVPMTGVLIVNKPSSMTSRAVVDRVARCIPGAKVGHAGTLDPLASGVLIVCIGSATRLVEMLLQLSKSYRTVVRLGARSDTLDADGRIEVETSPRVPSELNVQEVLHPFLGNVAQQPPDYSALKVKGRRAYDLARAGQAVKLTPRVVRIDRLVVLRYDWPQLEVEIDCGSGTYIRSIARDVGEALGCGGYVETLIRTRNRPVHPRSGGAGSSLTLSTRLDRSTHAPGARCHFRVCLGLPSIVFRSKLSPRAEDSGCGTCMSGPSPKASLRC